MKTNSCPTKISLLQSWILSVLSYAIEIWSSQHFENVEKIQLGFLKKILHLPLSTPGYAVRTEIRRTPITYTIFQAVINWLRKIFEITDDLYPKIFFNKLGKLTGGHSKYNWVWQVRKLLDVCDSSNFFNLVDLDFLKTNKHSILLKYKRILIELDKVYLKCISVMVWNGTTCIPS